jgi:hypothetical protein
MARCGVKRTRDLRVPGADTMESERLEPCKIKKRRIEAALTTCLECAASLALCMLVVPTGVDWFATAMYEYHGSKSGRPAPPPQGPLSRSYIFLARMLDETECRQREISDQAQHERLVMCAWTA